MKKRYAFLIIIYGAISIAARVMSPERERAIALGMEALPAVPGAARAPNARWAATTAGRGSIPGSSSREHRETRRRWPEQVAAPFKLLHAPMYMAEPAPPAKRARLHGDPRP